MYEQKSKNGTKLPLLRELLACALMNRELVWQRDVGKFRMNALNIE